MMAFVVNMINLTDSYQATTGDDPSLPSNELGMIATQMRSANLDGTGDTLVYRAVYYERSGSGPWDAQYYGSFVSARAIQPKRPGGAFLTERLLVFTDA